MPSTAIALNPSREKFRSTQGTIGKFSTNAPDESDWGGDEAGFLPVTRLMRQYTDYLGVKILEVDEQRMARHYYHGSHWTAEEIRVLKKRRQPIITFNRINRKIDGIVGLVEKLRQDPKAFPRNPRNAEGAEVATQAIRAVLDSIDWKTLDHECTERAGIEGIGGIELKLVEGDQNDPDLGADYVFMEDWFYDPRSRKSDFSDARFHGIAKWMDLEAAQDLFPDKRQEIADVMENGNAFDMSKHVDMQYKWTYTNERKVRIIEHWYKHRGQWMWCFYIATLVLDQGISPFMDERGKPMSRFLMFSAAVDQDGDRYGFVRNLKGPQDEINQRRSKALHISNSRRLLMEKGAVDDVETARREWVRPDGVLEINPGYSDKIKPDDTQNDLKGQLDFLNEAKAEIDSFANVNPALLAQGDPTEHSGVAIDLMQRAGLAELSKFILAHRTWKMRVYRAIWNIVQQTWTGERWLRVTDDQNVQKFIQVNGVDIDKNPQSPNFLKPVLVNALGSLDVDIILDEGPDVVSAMQDAFAFVKDDPTIPASVKLELSPLPASVKTRVQGVMQQAQQNQKPDPKAQAQIQTEQIKQQTAIATAKMEIQEQAIKSDAEKFNAQQDAQSRVQDAQLRQLEMRGQHEEFQQKLTLAREEHAFKMQELREQAVTRAAEHARKRKDAAERPKKATTK